MKRLTFAKTLVAAIALPLLAGCAPTTRTTVVQTRPPATETIIVKNPAPAPPMPTENIPEPPDTTYIWVRGAWEWRQNQWNWVPGHWEPSNPGHVWVQGTWEPYHGGYVWVPGHWR